MAPVIHSPEGDFSGDVVGVRFTDGRGETDNEGAIAYFERQGYGIDQTPAEAVFAEQTRDIGARSDVPPAGTPLTAEELARVAEHAAATERPEAPDQTQDAKRPHPVTDNVGTWFEYLSKIKPDHGLVLNEDLKRSQVIEAVKAIEAAQSA